MGYIFSLSTESWVTVCVSECFVNSLDLCCSLQNCRKSLHRRHTQMITNIAGTRARTWSCLCPSSLSGWLYLPSPPPAFLKKKKKNTPQTFVCWGDSPLAISVIAASCGTWGPAPKIPGGFLQSLLLRPTELGELLLPFFCVENG